MIILGTLLNMVAIGFLCWLLFTLAVFTLPFFVGVTTGMWAFNSDAGWFGAIIVGTLAAGPPSALASFCSEPCGHSGRSS